MIFIEGALIHYIDRGDFALCGAYWLNVTDNEDLVTCEECKKRLDEKENA